MQTGSTIFNSLGILIVVLLLLAIVLKKEYVVKRVITVNRSNKDTFEYLKMFIQGVSENKRSGSRIVGTSGIFSLWRSNQQQSGSATQNITSIIPFVRIEFGSKGFTPVKGLEKAYIRTEVVSESKTRIYWVSKIRIPYPFNLFLLFKNMEKMHGKNFEERLYRLKSNLENQH